MKIINKAKSWVFKEGLNPGMRVKIRLSKRKIDKTSITILEIKRDINTVLLK